MGRIWRSPVARAAACALAALQAGGAQPAALERSLKPFVAESKRYALHKPADWIVLEEPTEDSFRILVRPLDGSSSVEFYWARNPAGKPDALRFLAEFRQLMDQTCKEPAFSEAFLSTDSTRAVATVRCRTVKTPVKGRYYFESTARGVFAQGYLAPEASLAAQRPLLLNVMASLAFPGAPRVRMTQEPAPVREPDIQLPPLVARQAQDGSLSMRTPADWAFMAGAGRVVTGAPDGGMGFIFTSISGNPMLPNASIAQGVIGAPYQPPPRALQTILQAFGHRNIKVLSAAPDRATMQECLTAIRQQCDAQDIVARWSSAQGAECLGALQLINAQPSITGLWFVIISGVWGPESDFHRYLPLLEQVGESFSINDQYARRYIQSGLANLRRLQQQTAAAVQDLNRAREQNQADWEARQERKDYIESKWDDYRRGNSYWVSELEGGKIYRTDSGGTLDTATGAYYEGKPYNWVNFEGQNPRHPSENMRELSSWEVEHGRKPPK